MADRSPNRPLPLYILLACSIALNLVLLLRGGPSETPQSTETAEVLEEGVEGETTAESGPAAAQPEAGEAEIAGWTVTRGKVEQSLARTFQVEAGEDGDALSGVYTRLFVWDLDLRRDLQVGDSVAVAWRKGADGFPEIAAASLQTKKLGKTLTAYRWKAPEDTYASYWRLDGTEVPLRLRESPLAQYEQITSLLKDRPTHKGMDFKTPVGTEVSSPRAGQVTRANWNWSANGNCIEIRYEDGVIAKFLHLNENRVDEGHRVSAGQLIALSGNTGHSTAPHLHYQLDRGEKTLDPLEYHGSVRRTLDAAQVAAMRRDVAEFEKLLGEASGG